MDLAFLPQPHARPFAVRELDAGGLEGAADRIDIVRIATRRSGARFHSAQSWHRYVGGDGELGLTEASERASCGNLTARKPSWYAHCDGYLLTCQS
jgi:hypothetical protein